MTAEQKRWVRAMADVVDRLHQIDAALFDQLSVAESSALLGECPAYVIKVRGFLSQMKEQG